MYIYYSEFHIFLLGANTVCGIYAGGNELFFIGKEYFNAVKYKYKFEKILKRRVPLNIPLLDAFCLGA